MRLPRVPMAMTCSGCQHARWATRRHGRGRGFRGRRRAAAGQATVEVALILPVLATLLLVVVQVGLVVRDQILVTHAAREAVRAAAVDPAPAAAVSAAVDGSGLPASRLDVDVSGRAGPGSRVRATVAYRTPTDVPLVGRLVGDLTLRAEATMRVEDEWPSLE